MLFALLSPAKKLDFAPAPDFAHPTQPALMDDAARMAAHARQLSRAALARLMDISPKLAELNFARFQAFDAANVHGTKPALYAFAGDVYVGFNAASLSKQDVEFAQAHIGILSGLYGLLRPLDAIQPYRLEMGAAVKNERGKDLYAFWRKPLTAHINAVTAAMSRPTIVNLASEEYWSAVDAKELQAPVIQAVFKETKGGKARVVSFFAKKARGLMARYIVQERLDDPQDLRAFDADGYRFDARASQESTLVFSRKAR